MRGTNVRKLLVQPRPIKGANYPKTFVVVYFYRFSIDFYKFLEPGNLPVYGHKDFNNTDCPGANFLLEQFKNNSYRPTGGTEIVSDNGFYISNEERENATIVGEGNIEVLDEKGNVIQGRHISSLDRVFVLGIYPSRNHIELIYPGKNEKYHAYIDI